MEKYFALIKNNIVVNVIVADDSFLPLIKDQYDLIIEVTDLDHRPSIGHSYYPDVEEFVSNNETTINLPVDLEEEHLQQGTEDGFEPLKLSKYTATYENGVVTIGCKKYSAPGLLDAAYKVLKEKQQTTAVFTTSKEGPSHGKFGISWDDCQLIYDALIKVKF